jgi:arylsulfatase A-like enzyme
MDATATALDLARTAPEKTALDGVSLLPLLTGQTGHFSERPLFWRVGKQNATRLGEWKLIRSGKEWQLYDLAHDIGEATNLAPREPTRVQQMSALWDKWNAEQIEPLW